MGASNYAKAQERKHWYRTGSATKPTTLYVALVKTLATDTSTGSTLDEPSGGNYSRVQRNCSDSNWSGASAVDVEATNVAAIQFPTPSEDWGDIVGWATVDAATGGNVIHFGSFTETKGAGANDTFIIPAGELLIDWN